MIQKSGEDDKVRSKDNETHGEDSKVHTEDDGVCLEDNEEVFERLQICTKVKKKPSNDKKERSILNRVPPQYKTQN